MQKHSAIQVNQLRRQLSFIRNSAAAYDVGHTEEAIRIAVAIRVMMHDTLRSVSLLNQMGYKETIRLITTAKDVPTHILMEFDYGELLAGMWITKTIEYSAVPDGMPTIACSDWWEQSVFVRDQVTFSRKDIVLSAANKDGGAHVSEPDHKLLALKSGFWSVEHNVGDGQSICILIENNHFRMLRRFADELLLSTELLKLVV
jgi:hypothetical protein